MSFPRQYTYEEKQNILTYIIKNKLYDKVKGRVLWQNMEKKQVCKDRSWQSMKQHFRASIIKHLNEYNITDMERKLILDGYNKVSNQQKSTSSTCLISSEDENVEISDVNTTINEENIELIDSSACLIPSEDEDVEISDVNTTINEKNIEFIDLTIDSSGDETICFEIEENKKLVNFIKENMDWTKLRFNAAIFEKYKQETSSNYSTEEIKNNFYKEILPNLPKYNILNIDEVLLFYDRSGFEPSSDIFNNEIGVQTICDAVSLVNCYTILGNKIRFLPATQCEEVAENNEYIHIMPDNIYNKIQRINQILKNQEEKSNKFIEKLIFKENASNIESNSNGQNLNNMSDNSRSSSPVISNFRPVINLVNINTLLSQKTLVNGNLNSYCENESPNIQNNERLDLFSNTVEIIDSNNLLVRTSKEVKIKDNKKKQIKVINCRTLKKKKTKSYYSGKFQEFLDNPENRKYNLRCTKTTTE